MIFHPGSLKGAYTIELEKRSDERGFFARVFCEREFAEAGLEHRFVQVNDSYNSRKGTLRGMHYQLRPSSEVKVIRCIRGALFDVIVDLRPDSPTFGKWFGAELSAENGLMMYAPRGCAHGMITLQDNSEALYLSSTPYAANRERGLRWNDPYIGIRWPLEPTEISAKDAAWPDFTPEFHGTELMRGL
jgi:dTDP-4-dehydrorhamnose 3,5-epimerase